MTEYIKKNIIILGRSNTTLEKILYEKGQLFCPEGVEHDFKYDPEEYYSKLDYDPFISLYKAHSEKPLLYIEENGKCTAIAAAGSLIFVRYPDNRKECLSDKKILTQAEVAEIICVCGICHNWHSKATKGKRRGLNNLNWIGIANNLYAQGKNQDTLMKRLEIWLRRRQFIDADEKSLRTFMLEGQDYIFQEP